MSRKAVRPAKQPISSADASDREANTALEHLQRGRFRDAIECYKALLKTAQRPEFLALLAKAYEGRARALAAKGMRREAIELWRSRAQVCQVPLWDGPYPGWLIAEDRIFDVLGYLSTCRAACIAAPESQAAHALAALEAQLAPALLAANDTLCQQLPFESLLVQHRPRAQAAVAAYARKDGDALEEALAGISFRSPYRDLRSVLKALVLWETDREAARSAIERLAQDGPFEPLAAPLRSVVAAGFERWRRWACLNAGQQTVALELLGCPRSLAALMQPLSCANSDLAAGELFELVQRHARALPEAMATSVWQRLAPWAKRRGCSNPLIFGKPSKAQQECATALAVEIKGELRHAEEHWLNSVQLLASSGSQDDRERAALVLRHAADMPQHLSRDGKLDKSGARYLARSLEFDPHDCDVYVRLVRFWRHSGHLKTAREHLEAGLALFPLSAALLTEAVDAALAASAFKKAVSTAHRLLEIDPLNRKVRSLLGNSHLSHAGKHIAANKLDSAKREIEEARNWLSGAAEQGRLQLLLAWTEPAGSAERLRLAQLGVKAWGGGLAAGWRLLREAQGIFAGLDLPAALLLLGEAGITALEVLTPADVLGLVQALEQEPPKA
ncbi:MAG: hypothetical protein WCH44_10835 [Betaproteobacteria bacterium]